MLSEEMYVSTKSISIFMILLLSPQTPVLNHNKAYIKVGELFSAGCLSLCYLLITTGLLSLDNRGARALHVVAILTVSALQRAVIP
jgi:hypothetical protein